MTATAHTLVAGAIAAKFADPITASTLALLSHFIMDAIPHWDIGTGWRNRSKRKTGMFAILETSIGLFAGFLIFGGSAPPLTLTLAMFFSLLPDWLETPWYIWFATPQHTQPLAKATIWEKMSYRIYKMENFFHSRAQFPLGAITQVVTVIFFLILLK